ncbi:MAG: enhanced intracellular survival protein Eis [Candidatus Thorarchaeota archaeon]
MSGQLKKCNTDDKEEIWDLVSYAYGVPETSREGFLERLDIISKEFYIYKVDDVPVAAARMLPFKQNIRGLLKPMGGIGMVASSPEHRRMGYVHELMIAILKELKKQGYATSTLYPFKDTFYMAVGYTKMPMSRILEVDPRTLSGVSMPEGYSVKRESGDDVFKLWREIHEGMVLETHGAVMRNDDRWMERTSAFRAKAAVARNSSGKPEGIMTFGIKGYGDGHAWSEPGQLSIGDFHWTSIEARNAILNFIFRHADQITKVNILINSRTDDYYHWLTNIHTPTLKSGIFNMARIVDIQTAFSEMRTEKEGNLKLRVVDKQLDSNSSGYEFISQGGNLQVETTKEEPTTKISIEGLTAVLYGTLNEAQLRRLGWLSGESPELMFNWFGSATPWLTEDF